MQTILLAWAFGALLEGLVGFGYPWAVITPILVGLGVVELDAIRVAAIANNAPVSFGALGAPIIALAAVTKVCRSDQLSSSIGQIVALLALLPPWILIVLVTGRAGCAARGRWRSWDRCRLHPRAVPHVTMARARTCPTSSARWSRSRASSCCCGSGGRRRRSVSAECRSSKTARPICRREERTGTREAIRGLIPFGILIAVVVARHRTVVAPE